jgi:hypothetical protein
MSMNTPRRRFDERLRRRHAVGDDHRRWRCLEQALDMGGDAARLVGADDLDAVRMGEVEVADQGSGLRRFTPHGSAALAARQPRERQGLAIVVMQPRDVDLQHPAAMP